jgi:hypothetical protein
MKQKGSFTGILMLILERDYLSIYSLLLAFLIPFSVFFSNFDIDSYSYPILSTVASVQTSPAVGYLPIIYHYQPDPSLIYDLVMMSGALVPVILTLILFTKNAVLGFAKEIELGKLTALEMLPNGKRNVFIASIISSVLIPYALFVVSSFFYLFTSTGIFADFLLILLMGTTTLLTYFALALMTVSRYRDAGISLIILPVAIAYSYILSTVTAWTHSLIALIFTAFMNPASAAVAYYGLQPLIYFPPYPSTGHSGYATHSNLLFSSQGTVPFSTGVATVTIAGIVAMAVALFYAWISYKQMEIVK